eukprot:scaffold4224_cov43-Tisochrysis_lutea.AAC.1
MDTGLVCTAYLSRQTGSCTICSRCHSEAVSVISVTCTLHGYVAPQIKVVRAQQLAVKSILGNC